MTEALIGAGDSVAARAHPPPQPPPTTAAAQNRRPRVREVSSRFMSPLISSLAAATPIHVENQRSKSALRRHPHQQSLNEPLSSRAAEDDNIPDVMRNSTGSHMLGKSGILSTVQRKQQKAKVLKENGGARLEQQQVVDVPQLKRVSSRPDTPNVTGGDRIVPSRYRSTPHTLSRSSSVNSVGGSVHVSAAAKLLQEATSAPGSPRSVNNDSDTDDRVIGPRKLSRVSTARDDSDCSDTESLRGKSYPNSPVCVGSKMRTQSGMRSSMPEVERWLAEKNCNSMARNSADSDSLKATCARSLNLSRSSSDSVTSGSSSPWISMKSNEFPATVPSRSSAKSLCLPPQPTSTKTGLEANIKKGKKVANHQEDVHSLKLLHNHYLQWRYANARAEASMNSQTQEAERSLYSLGCKITDMREAVSRKRAELEILQRIKTLSTILETQLPYLEEWSSLEDEYSTCLSGAATALQNSSLQLPVSGVRIDTRELAESLNSAVKVMETLASDVESFVPKAEEIDSLASDLARVCGGERSLIEECGDILVKVHDSQIIECSFKGHMIQHHRIIKHSKPQEKE